jgi:DNA-binding HxlR family transcriptional regulator
MENKDTSKRRVKGKTLLMVLCGVAQHGDNIILLRNNLNLSKQTLNYHLNRLIEKELINRVQSYPFAIYELTPEGQRVKGILLQSQTHEPPIWDCHSLIVGFKIISYGTFHFENIADRKLIYMKNWHFVREEHGKYIANIHSTGLLKIYAPRLLTTNPEEAFAEMYGEAQDIARKYQNKFNMEFSKLKVIREGHKSLYGSEKLAKLIGNFNYKQEVWTDASSGTLEIEEKQGSNVIESLLEMPKQMEALMEAHNKLAVNLNLHIEVLTKMSNSLDEFNKNMVIMNEKLARLGN